MITDHLHRGDKEVGTGFDVVVLGYRGIGFDRNGERFKLKTPRFYSLLSSDDIAESMRHVYEKYCKPFGRRAFALGNSFGSNIMTLAMPKLDFIECFCHSSAVVDMTKSQMHIKNNLNGILNETFATTLLSMPEKHSEIMAPYYKEKHDFDLSEKIA